MSRHVHDGCLRREKLEQPLEPCGTLPQLAGVIEGDEMLELVDEKGKRAADELANPGQHRQNLGRLVFVTWRVLELECLDLRLVKLLSGEPAIWHPSSRTRPARRTRCGAALPF